MDKPPAQLLREGIEALALTVPAGVEDALWSYAETLLKWNAKVNLTAITRFAEVVDKHLIDSLAVMPEVEGTSTLLDIGSGAGLPGIPLALAMPGIKLVTMADTAGKKVAFMKTAIACARLTGRVRAIHARAVGAPDAEGLPLAEVVISRAFTEVGAWLKLGQRYLLPGGRVVVMLGQTPSAESLSATGAASGMSLTSRRTYQLPASKDPRGVAVFHVKQNTTG